MLFSNRNIDTFGQLAEVIKHYIGLQTQYLKLDVIEKVVRLITALALVLVMGVILFFILVYLSFTVILALTPLIGMLYASVCVTTIFVLLLALVWIFKQQWIERPVVRFLTRILLDNQ